MEPHFFALELPKTLDCAIRIKYGPLSVALRCLGMVWHCMNGKRLSSALKHKLMEGATYIRPYVFMVSKVHASIE
jgi:hypothetical protein